MKGDNLDTVSVGIIGAGSIAKTHLSAIQAIGGIHAVGITSRTKSKAQSLADQFGIPVCADDLESLVKTAKPDALLVLVSVDQVYDVACSAITYGLPLLIEKPAGIIPQETCNLARLARDHSVQTMVGYNRRYYSVFHQGLAIIQEHGQLLGVLVEGHERMGQVRSANKHPEHVLSHWVFANMTHTVDLLRFFAGEPTDVMSIAHRYSEPRGDQFAAIMEFESGAMGEYLAHWHSPGSWRVALYGQGVTVEFQPLETGRWTDSNFQTRQIEREGYDSQFKPGFFGQMTAFGELVRDGTAKWPLQDLEGAYRTMLLAEQITSNVSDRSQPAAKR